jgi:hypothetical protein
VATNVTTSPQAIAREFAAAIRGNPAVEQLWMRPGEDVIELWVITTPIGGDDELSIYEEAANLKRQYSDVYIRPLVLNPRFFSEGTDLESIVRSGAQRIKLRR